MAPAAASDLAGRLAAALAGRYLVTGPAGAGGMAVVFRAEDVRHGRPVAIKVLKPELASSLWSGRFLREIQIASRLQRAAARGSPVAFSLGWAIRQAGERFERTVDRADQELISVRVVARSRDWPRLPEEMERRNTPTGRTVES